MDIQQSENECSFFVIVDGIKAFLKYSVKDGLFDILTTQVPEKIGGRGIASALMKAALEYFNKQNLKPKKVLSCSYAQTYIERHKNN